MIKEIIIENFKCFNGRFSLKLNNGLNILVGDNEAGKSTILEAIHVALTGMIYGRYLKNDINQYLFNNHVVSCFLNDVANGKPAIPPHVLIEVYFDSTDMPEATELLSRALDSKPAAMFREHAKPRGQARGKSERRRAFIQGDA